MWLFYSYLESVDACIFSFNNDGWVKWKCKSNRGALCHWNFLFVIVYVYICKMLVNMCIFLLLYIYLPYYNKEQKEQKNENKYMFVSFKIKRSCQIVLNFSVSTCWIKFRVHFNGKQNIYKSF